MDSWERAVKKKFGFSAEHLTTSHSSWLIESWNKETYPELTNDKHLLSKLDKLHKDLANPKTNESPLSQQIISGKNHFISKGNNILTNLGMNEMAKRSTGQTSSTNTHHAIGIGTTSETISDTTLENELGRKVIGSLDVVNQTERYASAFIANDILPETPPQNISEAGILTESVGGILIMRITAIPVVLDTVGIITLLTNVTHQNGIEI